MNKNRILQKNINTVQFDKPHNKIHGRDLIEKRVEGIKICLETINNPNSHRDDILSAACYMGYRVMDGSYKDIDFVYQKILIAHELSKTISPPNDPAWFRIRWEASYLMLRIYFEYLVLNMAFPKKLMVELANIKIEDHPPQLVNMQRAHLFLFADAHSRENSVECKNWLWAAIASYKRAVQAYQPQKKSPETFIHECWEASECLNLITELGDTEPDKITSNKSIWEAKCIDRSRGNMYKVMRKIYFG